jgi:hypothetical protein
MRLTVAASELKEQITFEYHQHQTLGTARRTADQMHDLHLLRKAPRAFHGLTTGSTLEGTINKVCYSFYRVQSWKGSVDAAKSRVPSQAWSMKTTVLLTTDTVFPPLGGRPRTQPHPKHKGASILHEP